ALVPPRPLSLSGPTTSSSAALVPLAHPCVRGSLGPPLPPSPSPAGTECRAGPPRGPDHRRRTVSRTRPAAVGPVGAGLAGSAGRHPASLRSAPVEEPAGPR